MSRNGKVVVGDEEEVRHGLEADDLREVGCDNGLDLSSDSDEDHPLCSKRKVKKEAEEDSDSLDDRLEDDDFDLLEENLGVKITRRRKYKRVRKLSSDSDSDHFDAGINAADEESSILPHDEIEPLAQGSVPAGEDSDFDDFVVDESGNPVQLYSEPRLRINDENLKSAREIFGDGFDQEDFDDERDSEYDSDESNDSGTQRSHRQVKSLADVYEPALLEAAGLTDVAEKIRLTDQPERMILRSYPIRPPSSDSEVKAESDWIYDRAFSDRGNRSSIEKIIQDIVCFIRKDSYEVPYIQRYKRNMFEPYLLKDDLWTIYEKDEEFCRLVDRQQRLARVFIRMQAYVEVMDPGGVRPITETDLEHIRNIKTLLEARDMQAMFQLYYGDIAAELNEHLRAKKEELLALAAESIDPSLLDEQSLAENLLGDDTGGGAIGVRQRKGTHAGAYRCCVKNRIGEFIQRLGLSPEEFGENVTARSKKHLTSTCLEDLDAVANNYKSEKFPSIQEVVTAGKFMLARQISRDIQVRRSVREHLDKNAIITVAPTKKGFDEIDELHPLFSVKYLRKKPLHELDPVKFLELDMGEKDNLVELTIDASFNSQGKSFVAELISYFQSEFSERDHIWNKYRADVVILAYEKFILPESLKDLRRNLLNKAHKQIKDLCVKKLKEAIQVAPFGVTEIEDPDYNQNENPASDDAINSVQECKSLLVKRDISVMSLAFTDNQFDPVYFSVLSPMGQALEVGKLDYLLLKGNNGQISGYQQQLRQKGVGTILGLIKKHSTELIAVSSECKLALRLFLLLQESIKDAEDLEIDVNVLICDNEIPKVASKSKFCQDEFPDYCEVVRQAISLGRIMLDPLLEISQLYNKCNDILCVRFHKYQDKISNEELMDAFGKTFMDLTAGVGVDINEALKYSNRSSTLQFVSGLGFYRSLQIRRAFKSRGKVMENRNNLVTICKLGPTVFRNCAGFIRYDPSLLDGQSTDEGYIELLDATPIHPEAYDYARFICSEILRDVTEGIQDFDETDMFGVIEPFLKEDELNRDAIKALQDVDIYTMNKQLVETRKYPDLLCTWQDIRRALLYHKADLRFKQKPPTSEELFFMITKLDPKEFYTPGKLQYGTVTGFLLGDKFSRTGTNGFEETEENDDPVPLKDDKTGEIICPFCDHHMMESEYGAHWMNSSCQEYSRAKEVKIYFDNGLFGRISKENFSDEAIGCKLRMRVAINQQICVRIMDVDYARFSSKCSSKSSDLKDPIYMPVKDSSYDWDAEARDKKIFSEVAQKKLARQNVNTRRQISHHSFKNMTSDQIVKELECADSGDVLFHPSIRGPNYITLSWKVTGNILEHIDVLEKDKPHNLALGKKLMIGDLEYEDLDDIVAHYINPLAGWVRDLTKFRYYNESQKLENESNAYDFLVGVRQLNKPKIHYVISPSAKIPGTFLLSYLPKDKVFREKIRITPDGYVYRKRLFKDVHSFVDYFKENFNVPTVVSDLSLSETPLTSRVVCIKEAGKDKLPAPPMSIFTEVGTIDSRNNYNTSSIELSDSTLLIEDLVTENK